ncbi:MAG: hypothetical protein AVDCRST_MAG85-2350 [uncultured Solirubrobacteraceae bacterium]|uniref:Anti-sigma factor antagonist n=1 Tax=uncultured Solirubrobacteraceae bacterium TaxID=1162706 RepID=A0A6J4T195_9ACTN|nr:MAG: hypothetical protein AVDCRST_MAG85-2350 [uncultured Solirubrobacteraceae bacterium]
MDPTDKPPFSLDASVRGDTATIRLTGEVDLFTGSELSAVLDDLVSRGDVHTVVVDMREVTFLDSTGLRILLAAHQAEGYDLAVVQGSRAVVKAFEVTGLDRVLRFVEP